MQFSDYRMLVYAIVLILVMLATNNPTLKSLDLVRPGYVPEKRRQAAKKGGSADMYVKTGSRPHPTA